jgi:hypothetical protein
MLNGHAAGLAKEKTCGLCRKHFTVVTYGRKNNFVPLQREELVCAAKDCTFTFVSYGRKLFIRFPPAVGFINILCVFPTAIAK